MNKIITRKNIWIHVVLLLGAVFMVVPFIWMVLTSFQSLGESTRIPPVIIPARFHWDNYQRVFSALPFAAFYWNTIVTTVLKVFGQTILCSMAAYAFARIEFPGKNLFFILILSVMMVPDQSYTIPRYLLMMKFGWLNSLTALIVPGLFSSFGVFLLRQFFLSLPSDLGEAATIDGCNHFQSFLRIYLPLAKPGLISMGIFVTLWSWNDLMWPLIVNGSPKKMTLSVGLATLRGQYGTDYPILMAGAVLAIWPMILLFFTLQRHFVEGIALSGTKG